MDDYEVGYRKPPKSGQIRLGEIRNPFGRRGKNPLPSEPPLLPPEAKLLQSIDSEAVLVDGREMTRREAQIRALYHAALRGNASAIKAIDQLSQRATSEERGGSVVRLPFKGDFENWNVAEAVEQHTERMDTTK